MPQYKVSYFNIRGLAEHIRMLFLDQGIDFEDDQFPRDEWYSSRKAHTTFGQCPLLLEDGKEIAQSNTIMRHLARVHGLYGESESDKTMLDMVADGAHDLRLKYYQLIYREYERKEEFLAADLPGQLASFEKILAARPKPDAPFLTGDKIAYTDYILWELLECLFILSSACLSNFPRLKAYHGEMPSHRPKMADYLNSEKRKNLPLNNNGKQ